MAVQIIPIVAAIVGGAVTIGAGAYVYQKYNETAKTEPTPVISQPVKLLDEKKQEIGKEKPEIAKAPLPEFDLLRVEKDGSVLISGSATPNSVVEIVHGDSILGKTKSASNGDFVIVFDNPLKPGSYELYIQTTHKDGSIARSTEAGIVAIPEEGGELLAMVSKPSGPSKLIQVSKAEPKAEKRAMEVPKSDVKAEDKVAEKVEEAEKPLAPEKVVEKKPAQIAKAVVEPVKKQVPKNEPVVQEVAKQVVKEAVEKAVVKPEVVTRVEDKSKPVKTEKQAQVKPVEVARLEVEPVAPVKVEPIVEVKKEEPKIRNAEEIPATKNNVKPEIEVNVEPKIDSVKKEVAEKVAIVKESVTTTPKPVKPDPVPPVVVRPVYLGAVEVEDKKIFVAGTGEPNHVVNIYIDDKFVGNAKVDSNGSFLMESSSSLSIGNHTVRADMLGAAASTVVARAQVPLIHDQPVNAQEVAEAPKVVAEVPKPVVEPKVVAKMPKTVVEPKKVAELPKAVVEPEAVVVVPEKTVKTAQKTAEDTKNVVVAKLEEKKDTKKSGEVATEPVKKVEPEKQVQKAVVAGGEIEQSGVAVIVASKNEDQLKQEPVKQKTVSAGSEKGSAESVETVEKIKDAAGEQIEVAKLDNKLDKVEETARQLTRKLVKSVETNQPVAKKPVVKEVVKKEAVKIEVAKKEIAKEETVLQDVVEQPVVKSEPQKMVAKIEPQEITPPKQEVVEIVKPAGVVKKVPNPVQVAKTVVSPQPVVANEPKRVIRTSSSVIIRRGDNLWRISRRILGRGIRYSTIYQANRDQIKNPALIFPGQIFKVPEKMVDVDGSKKS